jgi:thioredoxin-like negative regulator of GroEL
MTPLSQELLEALLKNNVKDQAPINVVYFTAKWCGPCNGLPLHELIPSNKAIRWFLCDVDDNNYSSGFCGVKSIPAFLGIVNGKATPLLATSNPDTILRWLHALTLEAQKK